MLTQHQIKLLLVEDHIALREILTEALQGFGYYVEVFDSSESTISDWSKESHIALLDVNLPGEDGLYLAQQLRLESPSIGIILMTVRNQITDKLLGYEAGADVYLPKPISPEELHCAIKALARRIPNTLQHVLTLQHSTYQLSNLSQESVTLTDSECRLLNALSLAPQQRLEYWEIAEKLSLDLDSDTLHTNLEKRVSRLRSKLAKLAVTPKAIKTLRGQGYQLAVSIRII
ncbi:response regulator transcription factor [Marinomonas gallaica]|uniref:response regulator transcription factor n=1 Tax=Marinomonas gallaica TaxID=1806667 RepID=UPI003A91F7B8